MATRHNLKHSIIVLLKRNRDGSYATQAARKERLTSIADELVNNGYKLEHIRSIRTRHIYHLVNLWKERNLNPGTMKNRMSDLRWIAEKTNQPNLVPTNDKLGIPKRQYVTNENKSIELSSYDLSKISNSDVRMSLLLQQAFGLRRQESIKIQIHWATKIGGILRLKGSWNKNGRPRDIKIHYPEQIEIIKQCKEYIGKTYRALIPPNKTYKQQLKIYETQLMRAGIHKAHGLRHAYAQKRYKDLTGWDCPARGGPSFQQLTEQQKQIDREARMQITEDLGHERLEILQVYVN